MSVNWLKKHRATSFEVVKEPVKFGIVCSVLGILDPTIWFVHGHVMVRGYGGPMGAQRSREADRGGLGALDK